METVISTPDALRLAAVLKGPAYGIFQPVLVGNLSLPVSSDVDWSAVDRGIAQVLSIKISPGSDDRHPFFLRFANRALAIAILVQQRAGLAVFERGRVLGTQHRPSNETISSLALPYAPRYFKPAFAVLLWATRTLQHLIATQDTAETIARAQKQLAKLIKRLETLEPSDTNSPRIMKAAHRSGIPWDWVGGPWYQFGVGARQCLFNSTILDTTPAIAVTTARDKLACAHMLRRAGFPVPNHELARTLDDAQHIAARLGYPVVIKPANLDGGVGVAAGLKDAGQLEFAWAEAIKHSEHILVEKHQEGEDFRLIVLDGQLVWTVGRTPAGVTGDGVRTINELIALANQDPRRGYHATATLRPLKLDDEVLGVLSEQGLSPDSVPVAEQFVLLRRAANISSGGTPKVVNDRVHPDNRALVERAVRLLKLDLAGVDLIIPDIAKSWQETGAAIIEINAQPQLVAASQSHLYQQILDVRVPQRGRIPIAVFLGGEAAGSQAFVVNERLCARGMNVGLASSKGLWLNGKVIGRSGLSPFDAGKALLAQRDTEALLLVVDDESILKSGLPIDRYDLLVVCEPASSEADQVAFINRVLPLAVPHCTGELISTSPRTLSSVVQQGLVVPASAVVSDGASSMADQVTVRLLRTPANNDTP